MADWSQGSHAVITAARFDSDLVVFVRDDPSGTSAGMHAIYQGIPTANNRVTNGIVTWTQDGHSFSGRWEAAW